ncbi:MAG: potassium transporter Kup [Hyphomicrobiaceae bacterium]
MSIPDAAASTAAPGEESAKEHGHSGNLLILVLGAAGVVYGDIGTSPLYAFRESLAHSGQVSREAVVGIVSLLLWALTITVTLKYVVLIMRADNKGEGGTLSLMALAHTALGRRTGSVLALGVVGAALFYGDAVITPAISVMSAVEGLKLVTPGVDPLVVPIALVILTGLFAMQSRGTGSVAALFGPIMVIWFATLAVLGLIHIADDPEIFYAINPWYGVSFLIKHGEIGFLVLGAVVLAVTGGEALYADMGHFGKRPIRIAWTGLVLPALALNYFGQGAFVLSHPEAAHNPFFLMAPEWGLLPLVILATIATVIASQAVITGAYSLTQQAIQLGLLPRLKIRHVSETLMGQIYMPQVTALLFVGVVILVLVFRSSSNLASAYGIAVTGAMTVDTMLAFIVARGLWKWSPWLAATVIAPFLVIDLTFFSANLLKFTDGGYMPIVFGSMLAIAMWTWDRGTRMIRAKVRKDSVPITQLVKMLRRSKPHRVPGTAVFLTADPDSAPASLLHNLKHNKVLHKTNIIFTIRTLPTPRVATDEKIEVSELSEGVLRIIAKVGYMERPDVQQLLALSRRQGLHFDLMQTSFFLSRFRYVSDARSGMPKWQDKVFIGLTKVAADVTDFYHIPSGRLVELGSQMSI